ncbi:MAG: hypothetical protein ACTSV7_07515 [Candidatus Baldrarchaeia archaeon]
MILEYYIVDMKNRKLVYHYKNPNSNYQPDEDYTSEFATAIAKISSMLSPDMSEKIQRIQTTSFKIFFEVINDHIFMLVASADHDDLELSYALTELMNNSLPLLERGKIKELNVRDVILQGKVRLANRQALSKIILLRFGAVIKSLEKLKNEVNILSTMGGYDASTLAMISSMVKPVEQAVDELKEALKNLPYVE